MRQYKEKFSEFQSHAKKQKSTQKNFEKEIKKLASRKKQLEDLQNKVCKQLGVKTTDVVAIADEISKVEGMGQQWEAEKQKIITKIEEIKKECGEL